jgi:hypothetical protein
MGKVFAILIVGIILASGMQVTLDRHYCGGKLIDVKISVTGKLASCGMEQTESSCPNHPTINKKCCEDQISFYNLKSNYYPEYFKLTHPISERDILPVQAGSHLAGTSFNTDFINWVLPPGYTLKTWLTQSEICVFRI